MKEGFWIHRDSHAWWQVHEHALFAKSKEGADRMCLPPEVREEIAHLNPDFSGPGREAIVIAVMKAGYIRLRGYGDRYSFEFVGNPALSIEAIYKYLWSNAGPGTFISIHDLQDSWDYQGSCYEFTQRYLAGGADEVIRYTTPLARNPLRGKNDPNEA